MEGKAVVMDHGVAYRPAPGECECGDQHLVLERPGGGLVAVVDGLGHGPEATVAARAATEIIDAHSGEDVGPLMRRCHQRLRYLRGAALSLAIIDQPRSALTWLGVGNVLGLLVHPESNQRYERTFMVCRNGLVGQRLPSLRAETRDIVPGDLLVFATDGIDQDFPQALDPTCGPQGMADRILRDYALDTDDALVLVVRYQGGPGEPGSATLPR